jgi:hypothetical protein
MVEIARCQPSHQLHSDQHLPLQLLQLIQMQPLISLAGAMAAILLQQVRHTQCLPPALPSLRNGVAHSLALHIRLLVQHQALPQQHKLLHQAQQWLLRPRQVLREHVTP